MISTAPSLTRESEPGPANETGRGRARLFGGAAGLVVLEMLAVRLAVEFDVGWVAAIPVLLATVAIVRRSPPLAGVSLLLGWPLFACIDLPRMGAGAEHLPFLSILTVWTLLALCHRRLRDGTLRSLRQPVVLGYASTLLVFVAIGVGAAWSSGVLADPALRFLNWDIARSWFGFLFLGLLSVRTNRDVKALYAGLPLAFLAFPLSLPVGVWRDFISFRFSSGSSTNIGLSFGSLNTNTLGQAAGLVAVASLALCIAGPGPRLRRWLALGFCVGSAVAVATFSRQSLLGILFGALAAALATVRWRGFLPVAVVAGAAALVMFLLVASVPRSYGFRTRILEIAESPKRWESASAELRILDAEDALDQWAGAPLFGVGFGGQRFNKVLALVGPSRPGVDDTMSMSLRGSHNLAVAVLAETGIAGLVLLLVFLAGVLRRFLRFARREASLRRAAGREVYVGTWAVAAFLLVVQMISGGVGMGSTALIFVWAAMLAALGSEQGERRARSGRVESA